jgi:hypothetical protein
MGTSAYDGAQTAADILIGYNRYLRDEMVYMTNAEIHEIIKKLETCADSTHGPNRHYAVERLIEICREELDDRDLVRCLVEAGLVVGINSIGGDTVE